MAEFPAPADGIVLTHFIVASDVGRARATMPLETLTIRPHPAVHHARA